MRDSSPKSCTNVDVTPPYPFMSAQIRDRQETLAARNVMELGGGNSDINPDCEGTTCCCSNTNVPEDVSTVRVFTGYIQRS